MHMNETTNERRLFCRNAYDAAHLAEHTGTSTIITNSIEKYNWANTHKTKAATELNTTRMCMYCEHTHTL